MFKNEFEVRDFLVSSIEGISGVISNIWYEFKTIELLKLYLFLRYEKIY